MAARTVSAPLAQLPNALTIARLVVIPIVAVLILASDEGQSWEAAVLFAAAGVTDQIDGFLARRWHVESAFGRIADPLADRLLIDVTVILLWWVDRLPWVALLIPARDVVLMLATPLVVGRGYRFEVNMLGKIADPLADRLLIDVAVVLLWHAGQLPWAAFLIPARDIFLVFMTPVALRRGYRFEVNFLGKLATWFLYSSLAFVMVTSPETDWPVVLFWIGFGLAIASLVLYARKAGREVRR